MSKSLGNALDPLEIIEEYGADALRFSLIINSGQDLFISKEKFEIGRNFANKMWNASRLVLMNAPGIDPAFDLTSLKKMKNLDLPSKWIVSRFYTTLKNVGTSIERFRYSEAEGLIYEFFRGNFCDWYLEIIKDRWADTRVQNIAFKILEQSLKMIHPFMPFVTEEIWGRCHEGRGPISREPWPAYEKQLTNSAIDAQMQTIIGVVCAVRNARAQWNIKPADRVRCYLSSESEGDLELLRDNEPMLKNLARVEPLIIDRQASGEKNTAAFLVDGIKGAVLLGDLIDVEAEKTRILEEMDGLRKTLRGLTGRLQNKNFTEKAPQDIVEKEKARLASAQAKLGELEQVLAGLE
jgi:valyl-tRNA synthetase